MADYDNAAFRRRLAKIPRIVRKAMREAIEKDAEEWVRLAQSIAPVDPEDGVFLKPSIRSEPTETGGQVVRAGGKTTTRQTENGPYDYAVGQEFGTQHMPASPFFWPAYRSLKKRFTSRRRRALNKAVKEWNSNGG
ncbi:HK97 gp10 family phage protein [Rhizobium binae]|uniref:HK97 gp10 family phage protein n=1 Tax=Rhizobium binae TaxID=1138190 RepID=A0ABV2MRS7_9HYPH|nr:HK97-gp10 family putative phage morphogenesis protein [Rhizobium binae]MBX4993857.1 HK97 gp10 family phage protein [Rhizobium binae]NKL52093.1 HK97 gp10 family phage protein [Rhizobium leguminosarum bv. viciae]QSY83267.1 HK97 gp10 family phage protein [Rhizobium binae]